MPLSLSLMLCYNRSLLGGCVCVCFVLLFDDFYVFIFVVLLRPFTATQSILVAIPRVCLYYMRTITWLTFQDKLIYSLTLSFKYVHRHFTSCKKKLVLIWTWINQFLEEKLEPPNKGRLRCQHVSRWPIINIWCFPLIIGCSMSFPPLPRQRCVSFRMLSFMFMRSKEINLNTKFYMAWRQRLTPFAYNLNVSIGSLP